MTAAEAGPTGSTSPAPPSLIDLLQDLLQELPGLLSDRIELLSLELYRARLALSQLLVLLLMASVLAATAWLALWVGVAGWLVLTLELHWSAALLLVLLFNLGAAGLALARVRGLAERLTLPATQRHLMVAPAGARPPPGHAPQAAAEAADGHAPA